MTIAAGFPVWNPDDDFVVDQDDFSDLTVRQAPQDNFYYFFNDKKRRLVKHFVLDDKTAVTYVCDVTLIRKGERFTPRVAFAVRNKREQRIADLPVDDARGIKARVSLEGCYGQFWQLIAFVTSFKDVDVPQGSLALVSRDDKSIVSALQKRAPNSIRDIVKTILESGSVSLSQGDINDLLKRRQTLETFKRDLEVRAHDESHWQDFFELNKWLFGYGLDYRILRQETSQPNYGGTNVYGRGGQKGDYLTTSQGDINFTVLVEIKTPATKLLRGAKEIRNGAWSLSTELTDAVSQIQANADQWERESEKRANIDVLETKSIYTVEPKGIVVIGRLSELAPEHSKRETFERFRGSLHGLAVLTFDELYARARFIVENTGDD